MQSAFRSQCTPSYRLLTDDQIREIHLATLELLETVGVRVMDAEALELLRSAGCTLKADNLALLPNHLVEDAIASAPSRITIYDRKGGEAMHLEGRKVHYGLGTDLLETWDIHTGELRPCRLQDVINAAVTADFCDQIDFIASMAHPQDVATNMVYIESFRAQVLNSTKPIYFTAAGHADLEVIIAMAAAVAGGQDRLRERPFLMHYAEPTSPLVHSAGALQKLFLCADRGIPLNYVPAILSGASGPVTLAGSIVVANAEALSGLVIQQLRAKGAPMISGFSATPMDMQAGTTVYGSPDERLTHSACCELYHHYGLPVWGEAGCSDAKCLDEQAAMESAISILMAAQDGTNLVHDIGYLGQGLIASPAAIVMCNELISYVKRIMRGFDISRERLGLDAIRRVGPGGDFLTSDHTFEHHREEIWTPSLLNRQDPDEWKRSGRPQYGEAVTRKALEILEHHRPEPLAAEIQTRLSDLSAAAEKALANMFFKA